MEASAGLSEFIRREHPLLLGAMRLHCGDRRLAEELAQEALAMACDRWHEVSRMASPRAWLYRVAINLSSSWFRRGAAERRANARHGAVEARHDDPDVALRLVVREAVKGLPPMQRTALVCRHYLSLTTAETAVLMGCSEEAVRQNASRAVRTLRDRLESAPAEGEPRHV